ncbi:MAG: hypothetical protein ACYTG0_25305, partial [Planctomycetota bacterium]
MRSPKWPVICVALVALSVLAGGPATGGESEPPGRIAGRVVGADGAAVAGACVVVCDRHSGVPLGRETLRPFTEGFPKGAETTDLAFAVTDDEGRFSLEGLAAGRYRLVGQSWREVAAVEGLLEVNGKVIDLHGVADDVQVPSKAAESVVLRPLGTGVLRIDEDSGNNETLLLVSTAPPRADPILGFAGWGGPFVQNMIGGNRMPYGETTLHGLPEGKVYLAV